MSLILTHGRLWQGLLGLPTLHPTLDAKPVGERLFDIVWAPAHRLSLNHPDFVQPRG